MEPIYDMTKKQNFLSVDGETARSSYGEFFKVGEVVGHENEDAGSSIITRFEAKLEENEITVYTSEGSAHLDFITKFPPVEKETTGVKLVAKERIRQIIEEGWNFEHDDAYTDGSLGLAAAAYAFPTLEREKYSFMHVDFGKLKIPTWWPWSIKWWKPSSDNRIKELAKAGALIIAEIDRLLRAQKQSNNEKN